METDELEQSQQIPEHRQCVCAYTREKDRTNQGNGKKMGETGCQASLAFFNLLSNRARVRLNADAQYTNVGNARRRIPTKESSDPTLHTNTEIMV